MKPKIPNDGIEDAAQIINDVIKSIPGITVRDVIDSLDSAPKEDLFIKIDRNIVNVNGENMAEDEIEMEELVEKWEDQNKVNVGYEGPNGLKNIEKLVETIGYDDLEHFLNDNPAAIQALREFVVEWGDRTPEWKERLTEAVDEEEEDDEDVEE